MVCLGVVDPGGLVGGAGLVRPGETGGFGAVVVGAVEPGRVEPGEIVVEPGNTVGTKSVARSVAPMQFAID